MKELTYIQRMVLKDSTEISRLTEEFVEEIALQQINPDQDRINEFTEAQSKLATAISERLERLER
jgi:hypothetical protein